MTQTPNPGDEPRSEVNNRPPRFRRLRRLILPTGIVVLAGVAGGVWWGWRFVNEQLAPLVERNLSQTLARPVKLGRVERFTLTGLRFGPSEVPATPTDADQVSLQAIEVSFNPLQVLLTRTLKLGITLDHANLYLQQTKDGTWISTQIKQSEEEGPIKTEIDEVRFRDAVGVLVPWAKYGDKQGERITLQQVNGTARFFDKNQRVDFDISGQSTSGGQVRLFGETLVSPLRTKLQVQAQNFLASEVDRLVKLPIDLQAGRVNSNLGVEIAVNQKAPNLNGTAQFDGITMRIPRTPTPFSQAKGGLQFNGSLIRLDKVNARYGKVPLLANGDIDTRKGFNLTAQVRPVSLPTVIDTLKLQVPFPVLGEVVADLKVTGALDRPVISGTARNTKPSRVDRVDLSRLAAAFRFDAVGQTLTVPKAEATPMGGGLITAGGVVRLQGRPTLAFTADADNVGADPIVRAYAGSGVNLPFAIGRLNGRAELTGPTDAIVVTIPTAQLSPGVGGVVNIAGRVALGGTSPRLALNFQAVNVPGDAVARAYSNGNALPIRVGRVDAQGGVTGTIANPQTLVRWRAPEATYAGSGEVAIANNVISLRDTRLTVAGGTVQAEAQAANGRWQAIVTGAGVRLNQFSPELRGLFSGQLALAGSLSSFQPADVRAQGQVRFSEGVSLLNRPLTAQIRWDGQKVVVQQATAPGFSANGFLFARLAGAGAPALSGLDLNVRATDYDLRDFPLRLPVSVAYSGQADFAGRITGTPAAPQVTGDLALRQFILNGTAFDPLLRGEVRVANGVKLNLVGARDEIAVTLSSTYQPVAFDIRRGDATATGRTQNGILLVEAQNLPIGLIKPANLAAFPVAGTLSTTTPLRVDLKRFNVEGTVAVTQPSFGGFSADRLGGQIRFANGVASVANLILQRCDPQYRREGVCNPEFQTEFRLNGSVALSGRAPQVNGQLSVANGRLQDVLGLLQVSELADLTRGLNAPTSGNKNDLQTTPIDLTNARLLDQLRRLSEVKTLAAQAEAQRAASPLPDLRELQGRFNATVNVAGALPTGITANFNVEGSDWQWGPYQAKQVVAIGSYDKGTISLLPLRFQSDQSVISFTGQVGTGQQSGQLRIENLPIAPLRDALANLTQGRSQLVNLDGSLNATATISGSLSDPQAIGFLAIQNGVLNNTALQEARGNFQYSRARLGFGTTFLLADTREPLLVNGSIPYKLPFATVAPDTNAIALDINVKNDGLAVLNVLNNQVAWQDGQGEVRLNVGGTLNAPLATGVVRITNATLTTRTLPEPLTNVNGEITFNRDRLIVQKVTGVYSRGQITASGVLPLADPFAAGDRDFGQALAVNLTGIGLNLKGLYRGLVNGNITVAGAALRPRIGGQIQLSNGNVLLAGAAGNSSSGTGGSTGTGGRPNGGTAPDQSGFEVGFDNLQLQLGDSVRVTNPPLINFVARGDLSINGTLDDLQPSGTIRLTAGQVNLFTTQFTLARGYPQTATFVPAQGLDPTLDVRLIAVVPEVTRYRQPTNILSSEVLDTPTSVSSLGGLQTVRVQAQVQGRASQLFDELRLTSTPARSESEIVALIGGGFVQTLGRGDSTLGIANLAGSALLTNIQTVIGNALGLSEFRLFPTLTRQDRVRGDSRNGATTLGLAAEAAIDITPSISFSVLRILTAGQPTQFGLRYRLNENLLFRSSTDFSGDSRAVLEYEARF